MGNQRTGKRSADICTRAELLVRVCDNSTKRYKNIYINKEKIPLDLSLSLSLSLVVVVVVVSRRAFSLALVVHFSSVEYLLLSRCVQFFVSFS